MLSQPSAAKARRIPWVAALRGYAASVSASSSGLSFDYRLDTTGGSLTPAQLPFAPGTTAPGLRRLAPDHVRDPQPRPDRRVRRIGAAGQRARSSYATFLTRQARSARKTGVDLNSLLKLLTGDLIIASDTKTTMGRAQVSDPERRPSDAREAGRPRRRSLFQAATSVTRAGAFYAISNRAERTVAARGRR